MAEHKRMNILTGTMERPRSPARKVSAGPQPEGPMHPIEQVLRRVVDWSQNKITEEALERSKLLQAAVADEQRAKAQLETRISEQRAAAEGATAEHQAAIERARLTLASANTVAEHLRVELTQKEVESSRAHAELVRITEEHRQAIVATKAAAEVEAAARPARIVIQPPVKPEKIDFEYHRAANGLLNSVVLKAAGYDDVAIDIVRGGDNRMKQLKVR